MWDAKVNRLPDFNPDQKRQNYHPTAAWYMLSESTWWCLFHFKFTISCTFSF